MNRVIRVLGISVTLLFMRPAVPQQVCGASCLVERLASDPNKAWAFSCGRAVAEFRTSKQLVAMGKDALPPVEAALDDVAKLGYPSRYSMNAANLASVYATIVGRQALPRIQMVAARLKGLGLGIDIVTAEALGLSAYVSTRRTKEEIESPCHIQDDPKFALNRVVQGFLTGDAEVVEQVLGPRARGSFRQAAGAGAWADWVRTLAKAPSRGEEAALGIGYRLGTLGSGWSISPYSLRDFPAGKAQETEPRPIDKLRLVAQFTDAGGKPCGRLRIQYRRNGDLPRNPWGWSIDNDDVPRLIRVLRSCTAL